MKDIKSYSGKSVRRNFLMGLVAFWVGVALLSATAFIPLVSMINDDGSAKVEESQSDSELAEEDVGETYNRYEVLIPLISEVIFLSVSAFYSLFLIILGKSPYAEAVKGQILEDRATYTEHMPTVMYSSIEENGTQISTTDAFPENQQSFPRILRMWLKGESDVMIRFFGIESLMLEYKHGGKVTKVNLKECILSAHDPDRKQWHVLQQKKPNIYPCMHTKELCCIPVGLALDRKDDRQMEIFQDFKDKIYLQAVIRLYNNRGHLQKRVIQLELSQSENDMNGIYWETSNEA